MKISSSFCLCPVSVEMEETLFHGETFSTNATTTVLVIRGLWPHLQSLIIKSFIGFRKVDSDSLFLFSRRSSLLFFSVIHLLNIEREIIIKPCLAVFFCACRVHCCVCGVRFKSLIKNRLRSKSVTLASSRWYQLNIPPCWNGSSEILLVRFILLLFY